MSTSSRRCQRNAYRRGGLRLGGNLEALGDFDAGVDQKPLDEGRLARAVVTGHDDAGHGLLEQRPDRRRGQRARRRPSEDVKGRGEPLGAGAGRRVERRRPVSDRSRSASRSGRPDCLAAVLGLHPRLGFVKTFGVGAPVFAQPQEPVGGWFTGESMTLQILGDVRQEMAGVGHLGKRIDGLLRSCAAASAVLATRRSAVARSTSSARRSWAAFERIRLKSSTNEALDLVERLVDGSAARRSGIAEGRLSLVGGLPAQPSPDKADGHAAHGRPLRLTAKMVHPTGFQKFRAATIRRRRCRCSAGHCRPEGPAEAPPGPASGPFGAREGGDGGGQVSPHVVGHQREALRQILLEFAPTCGRPIRLRPAPGPAPRCRKISGARSSPASKESSMRRSAFRNAADFGVLRPAARRCWHVGAARWRRRPRTRRPAASPVRRSLRQVPLGRAPDDTEDIGDTPFELLGGDGGDLAVSGPSARSGSASSTPRACS